MGYFLLREEVSFVNLKKINFLKIFMAGSDEFSQLPLQDLPIHNSLSGYTY